MGRTPCCEKMGLKKGPWSPEEDQILISFVQNYGHGNWRALPKQAGLLRCGKSCRLRWINYLRPDIKRGNFTEEEEETIIKLHEMLGNRWSAIATSLPGRTDNEIKNVWHTHLKKKLNKNNHVISKNHKPEIKKDSSSKRHPTCSITTTNVTDQLEAPTTSISSQPSSSDFSSVTETTSFGTEETNKNDKDNVVVVEDENDMEYKFPEIDKSLVENSNSNTTSNPSNFSYPFSPSNVDLVDLGYDYGASDIMLGHDMNFWYDIFIKAGGSPESPEF